MKDYMLRVTVDDSAPEAVVVHQLLVGAVQMHVNFNDEAILNRVEVTDPSDAALAHYGVKLIDSRH